MNPFSITTVKKHLNNNNLKSKRMKIMNSFNESLFVRSERRMFVNHILNLDNDSTNSLDE